MAVPPDFQSSPAVSVPARRGLTVSEPALEHAPDPQTRERLLQAAIAVFDRKGYAAASIREIVEKAGVTKPVLYYHFGSKEGLLGAVIAEGERQLRETVARALDRPGSPRERIIALAEDLYRQIQDNQASMRLVHALFFAPAEAAPPFDFSAFDRVLVGAVQRLVEESTASGRCAADARDIAIAITGVIGGCAARQLHPGLEPVSLDSLPRILGLVLDGVLQRSTSGESRS
jgi:AcrR family transcriptional regulator